MFTRMFARKKAFSLVEILGGVAVAVTLATVAVVGVKDTVVSGQKAAAQQEIRQLNQALQNYKSAGGTIPTGALAGEVIDLLQAGVGLVSQEGEKYTPLVNDPPMQMSIGGEPYDLVYNDEDGFSYTPSSQVEGSSSGGPSGTQDPASYPFDINDDAATQDAFNAFQNLPYGDLARQQYLDAFNAAKAMGYLSPEELAQLETILAEDGLVLNVKGYGWMHPSTTKTWKPHSMPSGPCKTSALKTTKPTSWR
jgi:type II secretory pathway pseudopilin PulG